MIGVNWQIDIVMVEIQLSERGWMEQDYLGDVDLRPLLTTMVENLHAVSHFKNETFTAL